MEKVGAYTERATAEGEWRPGDPATGQQATPMLAQYFNMLQRELLAVLTAGGVVPDIGSESQILAAIERLAGRGVTTITANDSPRALTVADAGLLLVDASAGAVDITLPAASGSEGLRYTLLRLDSEANSITVTPDGADTIDGAATLDLAVGDRRGLVCDGVDAWLRPDPVASEGVAGLIKRATDTMVQDGLDAESAVTPAGLASFGKSHSQFGYQKLPGGLILQWGNDSYSDLNTVSFPIAFPNACLYAGATEGTIGGVGSTSIILAGVAPDSFTKTSFKVRLAERDGSSGSSNATWLALGF